MQFAQGTSVTTPQQARTDLVAKKDTAAVQVASLRDKLSGSDQTFGFGGKTPEETGAQTAQIDNQLQAATRDLNKLSDQVASIDKLQPPADTTVLADGTWTMQGDKAVFQTTAPYDPNKKYVIPYVVRSAQGEVIEMGYLPVNTVQVGSHP
jgi:hypothetical protein